MKKGISPLIATVLLLVLVVVIGAIIMTYVRTYTTESLSTASRVTAKETTCTINTAINWVRVGDYLKVCFNNESGAQEVRAMFTNDGEIALKGYKVRVTTDTQILTYEVDGEIAVGAGALFKSESINPGILANSSRVDKVEIIPKIVVPGKNEEAYCVNNKIEADNLLNCTQVQMS